MRQAAPPGEEEGEDDEGEEAGKVWSAGARAGREAESWLPSPSLPLLLGSGIWRRSTMDSRSSCARLSCWSRLSSPTQPPPSPWAMAASTSPPSPSSSDT